MAVILPEKWSQLRLPAIGRADPLEQERLLKLFWNRAELKKELQALDDQLHNLRNKLKQQENANSRLQQQLEQLEVLLGNTDRGHDALVHFGLKALWRACRDQLEQFAGDIKLQKQDRERKQQLAEFQQDRSERLKVADQRLREAVQVADDERDRLRRLEETLARLRGFWNYFRRRELAAEILAQRERCVVAERQLADMREAHRTIEKEPWPEFPGLTIDGRRSVNLAVIAYAQILYARMAASGIAMDARLANNRSVESARHGSVESCLARLQEIDAALALVRSQDGIAAEIKRRCDRMVTVATWRSPTETVPQPASLPPAASGGVPDANVLVEDYWDVYKVLLR
jgi:prefoldin subunit 5